LNCCSSINVISEMDGNSIPATAIDRRRKRFSGLTS
jgi:hypothetical protein